MKFHWEINADDETKYRDFIKLYEGRDFVKSRITKNIEHVGLDISEANFWKNLLVCLLTTQQRTSPGSMVDRFTNSNNILFDFSYCFNVKNLAIVAKKTLSINRLRRSNLIASEIECAAIWLKTNSWKIVESQLTSISSNTSVNKERSVARFFQGHFKGFKGIGPKQSRNLIQLMGLSKYEIPLDSRMVKVLKRLGFPVPLSPFALADEDYYCFIEEGIQLIMNRIDIYPCVFDACAYASFDRNSNK